VGSYVPPTRWEQLRESLRRRGASAALVIALHALLLFLLLRLAPLPDVPDTPSRPTTVTLVPGEEAAPAEAPAPAEQPKPAAAAAPSPPKAVQPPPVPLVKTKPVNEAPDGPPLTYWKGMEKFDLAKVASSGPSGSAGNPGASAGAGDAVVGTAPGGEKLYNAQWHRRPTSAEFSTYLPPRMQNGWGMVACRTVADYRVDDCREVGQSPAGSGLSRAVREASWQFRVRPPRVGGKSMVGEWVRIRIEWNEGVPR
jgi:protein TonB